MGNYSEKPTSIGERLKARRESLGWSIDDLSRKTSIPEKYIYAFEEDGYDAFPAKVYALGFLKKALTILSFDDAGELLKEFTNEWDVRHYREPKEIRPLPQNRGPEPYLTPRRMSIAAAALLFLLFLGYLGFRFVSFVSAPQLTFEEPENLIAVSEPVIRVRGKVEKESQLTVNGREIMLDEHGNFEDTLELAAGVNALEFLVRDRFGKESRVVRYVLVR